MILAGDIGGTNARLAVFDVLDGRFSLISASVFPSREYRSLDEIVSKFVRTANVHPHAACFGVAGPVRNSLNQVKGTPVGNQAVISAGTGLGEAGMYWDGTKHLVFASEGGHADFAPRNELETELLRYLRVRFGHVSYERIVSGPGLVNVFNFLRDTGRGVEPKWLADEMLHSDPAAAISRAAIDGKCGLSEQAIDLFVSIYGAEAGNLALKIMATGGIYLGGGIAPKMLPKLAGPLFMEGFLSKGRMQHLLEAIPVRVITNDKVALLGAARYAVVRTTA